MSTYMLFALLSNECSDPIRVNRAIEVLRGTAEPEAADEQDPAEWPEWTDKDRWVPSEPFEPTVEDLLDYQRWSERLDREFHHEHPEPGRITDQDVLAGGSAIG